jgi:hypothetical protein
VVLKFTFGKEFTIVIVLHVLDMAKNLISDNVLNKRVFKLVYEFDKFILSKNGVFVGKGYSCSSMIKMNVME